MNWLSYTIIENFASILVLLVIYFYLYHYYKERYLGIWTLSWFFYDVRLLFEYVISTGYRTGPVLICNQILSLSSGILFLWGTYTFIGRPFPKKWLYFYCLTSLWIIIAITFRFPFDLMTLPTFTLLGFTSIWTGMKYIQLKNIEPISKNITGYAFILWGIHNIDYPFMRQIDLFAPYGYTLSSLFILLIAFGIFLVYFHRINSALEKRKQYFTMLVEQAADAIFLHDARGNILDVNQQACNSLGYSRDELLKLTVADFETDITPDKLGHIRESITLQNPVTLYGINKRKDGTTFPVEVRLGILDTVEDKLFLSLVRDITERKQMEERERLAHAVLEHLNQLGGTEDTIRDILQMVKQSTGFEAAGIRLRKGYDFPYFVQDGFPTDFLLTENTLTVQCPDGGPCRDKDGKICLECTCGLVISGHTDPANPLFTPGGSFWTNDSFPLLDLQADQDPRFHPRNRCIHEGFHSFALVPLRAGKDIIGLFQLNDRRKDQFTLDMILFFEGLCDSIGIALSRKLAEEALRTSEERLSLALKAAGQSIYDSNLKTGEAIVSPEYALMLEYDPAEFHETLAKWIQRLHPDDKKHEAAVYSAYLKGEIPEYKVEVRQKTKSGKWKWILSLAKITERDADGNPLRMIGTHTDITERKQAEEKIRYLATHDALTDLPTLRLVKDRISVALERAKRNKTLVAIMYIDLDGFKDVNDNYGHEAGDVLLREVGKRLLSCVRKVDTVARIGGDEFLMVIPELQSPQGAALIAGKILQLVSEPFALNGKHSTIGASIGIALYPDHGDDVDSLIKQADKAMYVIKHSVKNGYAFVNITK